MKSRGGIEACLAEVYIIYGVQGVLVSARQIGNQRRRAHPSISSKNIRQPVTDLRHCLGSRLISLRVGPQKAFHTVRLDVRGTRPDPEGPGARVP